MTRRAGYVSLALLVAAGVVWLLAYVGEADTYYQSGDVISLGARAKVERLDLLRRGIALGIASIAGLVVCAAGKADRFCRAVIGLTVVALLSLPVAWVAVTTGH